MKRKFTQSRDGRERCTIRVEYRVTPEVLKQLEEVIAWRSKRSPCTIADLIHANGQNYIDYQLSEDIEEIRRGEEY